MKREETVDFNIKVVWHSIARMYNQQASKYDASMNMGFALLNISSEGTPATKIAPLMGLETRSLTRLLKTLEEKNLIFRKLDQQDKRCVRVFLTPEGIKQKEKAREAVIRFNEVIREDIGEKKLSFLLEILQRINALIDQQLIFEKEMVI